MMNWIGKNNDFPWFIDDLPTKHGDSPVIHQWFQATSSDQGGGGGGLQRLEWWEPGGLDENMFWCGLTVGIIMGL